MPSKIDRAGFRFTMHMTIAEVAQEMGLSNNSVFQIEQRALNKLERAFRHCGLEVKDFVPDEPRRRGNLKRNDGSDGAYAEHAAPHLSLE